MSNVSPRRSYSGCRGFWVDFRSCGRTVIGRQPKAGQATALCTGVWMLAGAWRWPMMRKDEIKPNERRVAWDTRPQRAFGGSERRSQGGGARIPNRRPTLAWKVRLTVSCHANLFWPIFPSEKCCYLAYTFDLRSNPLSTIFSARSGALILLKIKKGPIVPGSTCTASPRRFLPPLARCPPFLQLI